jgi:hypothetical protein
MTNSKSNKLRVAIIVDPAGTMTGPSAEEEVEQYEREFTEFLKPAEVSFQKLWSFHGVRPNTDLIVFDYGGMMPGSSVMEDNSRRVVEWAQDNPTSLVVVMSQFTFRNYVKNDMEDLGLDLKNVVCGVGHGIDDPIPSWWREMNSLSTPDLDAIDEIRYPTIDVKLAEPEPEPEVVSKPEPEPLIQKGPIKEPIGYIRVPVYCDWRPKQTTGNLRFKLADCMVDVTEGEGENEREVGHLGGAFFGFYECSFPDGKGSSWQYSVSAKDFWPEFVKLHVEFKEKDL